MFYNLNLEEEVAMTNILFIYFICIMIITPNTLTKHATRKIFGFEIYNNATVKWVNIQNLYEGTGFRIWIL